MRIVFGDYGLLVIVTTTLLKTKEIAKKEGCINERK